DPVVRDAGALGGGDHARVVGVEEDLPLRLVEVGVLGRGGGFEHAVGVVEDEADVAQAADAGLGADGGQADLDAGEAEGALLGLAGAVVEVDLLVRAAGDAHPPAAAAVLVDEDDAVLLARVDRAGGAGGRAGRVEAVLADARQVEHEGLLEFQLDLLGDLAEQHVLLAVAVRTAEVVVPVRRPGDLQVLAGDEGLGAGDRGVFLQGGVDEGLVVVGPGLVFLGPGLALVAQGRQAGVAEAGDQLLQPAAGLEAAPASLVQSPAAAPGVLVLVAAGVAPAGPCLDVREPRVLNPVAVGPRRF